MLSDYGTMTLQWVQPKALQPNNFDLMANDTRLMTYRLVRPLPGITIAQSDRHRLTFSPERLQTRWVITGRDRQPVAVIKGAHKRHNSFTVVSGLTYQWQTQGFWGTKRIFRVAGGPDVLHVTRAAMAFRTGAEVYLTGAEIPERDLVLLCALAIHLIVLERNAAAVSATV